MARPRKADSEIAYNTKLQRNWTPEQREANRLYQREYRIKNKHVYAKAQLRHAMKLVAALDNGEQHEK